MGNLSTFQIVVLGVFSVLILVGVGIFAAFGGLLGGASVGKVVVWGTMNEEDVGKVIDTLRINDKSFEQVSYVEKDPLNYKQELVSAMAAGTAPDLFLISQEDLVTFEDKVLTIPYSVVSQNAIVNQFVDESRLLLTDKGSLGLPFTIDPLVMYWNRDLFATAGLAQAPQYWNDFLEISPKITSLDQGSNVRRSAVALGEWQNVVNAKAILSALFLQAGDYIVVRGGDGKLVSVFGTTPENAAANPAASALRFYTEFANPSKTTYSWNRAMPKSTDAFTAGDTAVYFGFASEYKQLLKKNPNLNVGVAVVPQLQGNTTSITSGNMLALSIPKVAVNPNGALIIAQKLTSQQGIAIISQQIGLPPARRDVPVETSNNAAAAVFVQSSLIARSWLDPDPVRTNDYFKTMIESVVSGRNTPAETVAEVASELQQLVGF
ncbi:extracellular solute-binding protein [Candidatus Parcubacteria bacterium]|nr:extracellular solute-binding protein [Candidatus Parcubacteria bacterium]